MYVCVYLCNYDWCVTANRYNKQHAVMPLLIHTTYVDIHF